MSEGAKQCGYTIQGPRVGRHVVLWQRQCRNKTTHPSGRCYLHRGVQRAVSEE